MRGREWRGRGEDGDGDGRDITRAGLGWGGRERGMRAWCDELLGGMRTDRYLVIALFWRGVAETCLAATGARAHKAPGFLDQERYIGPSR